MSSPGTWRGCCGWGLGVPQSFPLPVGGSSPGAALAASPQPVGAADGMLWDGGSGWMLWDGAVDGCCGAGRVAPLATQRLDLPVAKSCRGAGIKGDIFG